MSSLCYSTFSYFPEDKNFKETNAGDTHHFSHVMSHMVCVIDTHGLKARTIAVQ